MSQNRTLLLIVAVCLAAPAFSTSSGIGQLPAPANSHLSFRSPKASANAFPLSRSQKDPEVLRGATPPPFPHGPTGRAANVPERNGGVAAAAAKSTVKTAHFEITYPGNFTNEQIDEAKQLAEDGWARCDKMFGEAPTARIHLDLTARFLGATGMTFPGNARRQPYILVRYSELDYLGLSKEYVLTHEIGHVFSGPLAGSTLGEGIADWAAGEFSGVVLRQWWGKTLQDAGIWIDPNLLFITGEYFSSGDVDTLNRTATYTESALLVQYLVDRFGWQGFKSFLPDYSKARGALEGNNVRARHPAIVPNRPGRPDRRPQQPLPPPDAAAVRETFQKHFGVSWESLLADWKQKVAAVSPPGHPAEHLVLAERIYGAIRNYEYWLGQQKPEPSREAQAQIRDAFTRANHALAGDDIAGATLAFKEASDLVTRLRSGPRSNPTDRWASYQPHPDVNRFGWTGGWKSSA